MASVHVHFCLLSQLLCLLCSQHHSAKAEEQCDFSMAVSSASGGSESQQPCVFSQGLDQTQPYRFESLQCALEAVSTATNVNSSSPSLNGTRSFCIELASSEQHQLPYGKTLQFSSSSVDVVIHSDAGSEALMSCAGAGEAGDIATGHPLAMQEVASVHMRGLSFSGCLKPLLFLSSGKVEIENCTFTNFNGSAIKIYDTPVVKISSSNFTNNANYGTELVTNGGNAGAVNIGYNNTYSNSLYPTVTIDSTTFVNNTSVAPVGRCNVKSNSALSLKYYPGRAGAIGFYLASYGTEINIHISNSKFYGNKADLAGGAVYVVQSGMFNASNLIHLTNCTFVDNSAANAGAVEVAFDTMDSINNPGLLEIQNCTFIRNSASHGGAVKCLQLEAQGNENQLIVKDSRFIENNASIGSGLYLYKQYYGLQIENAKRVEQSVISNCMFSENLSIRGVIFINLHQVHFSGTNSFLGNTGPSIRVIGTLISMQGTLRFWNNRNSHEGLSGTVYVASFGQILLVPPLSVEFINNTGIEGAAIVVKSPRISGGFVQNIYNPVCFLQFNDTTLPPVDWKSRNVSMIFGGNVASIGPVLYISSLEACSWFNNSSPYFNLNIAETWTFMDLRRSNYVLQKGDAIDDPGRYIQTEIHSVKVEAFHMTNGLVGNSTLAAEECNKNANCSSELYVNVHPGQRLSLSLTALDQYGHSTSGFLRIRTESQLKSGGSIDLSPTIIKADVDSESQRFHYMGSQTNGSVRVFFNASFSPVEVSASFYLNYAECPPGYSVPESYDNCTCERRKEILDCDEDYSYVLLVDGLWGAGPELSQTLLTYSCPPGYCSCTGSPTDNSTEGCVLYFDEPFRICHSDRTGVLCGECTGDLGVGMLTMDCRRFTAKYNMYYWLLPLLVLSVTVILVLVIRTGFKVPSLLRGFIYYIQISGVAVSYVPQSINLAANPMACVASALALYVPYDFALHQNLTALESVGLRYVSPALALAVVPVAMRIKHNPISWNGLWTLILLMYAMSISTSISLTFCVSLELEKESRTVWFYDGSVECYKGAHLALMIVACVWLVLAALLVPFLAVVSYQSEINNKFKNILGRHFDKCSKVLVEPYKENCKWWASYEFLRRYIFIMCAILIPTKLTWPISLIIVDLTLQWFVQPYKDRLSNVAESFCLGSLAIILCLADTTGIQTLSAQSMDVILWPLLYLPLVTGVLCGVAIVAINLWRFLRRTIKVKREAKMKAPFFRRSSTLHVKEKREEVTKTHVGINEDEDALLN